MGYEEVAQLASLQDAAHVERIYVRTHPARSTPPNAPSQAAPAATTGELAAPVDAQQRQVTFVLTTGAKDFLGPVTDERRFWPLTDESTCSYPDCHCPFDAPSDPNWCARGWPKKARSAATGSST